MQPHKIGGGFVSLRMRCEQQVQSKDCNIGLDQRCRDNDGEIRRKRSDTLVGTLRREYGDEFAQGTRSDTKLGTVLRRSGARSLTDYLKNKK